MDNVKEYIEFRGGKYVSFIPFCTFLVGCFALAFTGYATMEGFWVVAALCVILALFLAKSPSKCFDSIVQGTATPLISVAVLCWIFSGIFAGILKMSGLVDGLIWLGLNTKLTGGLFVGFSFILAALYATATGTGSGTIAAMAALLYPAGVALGANPMVMAGAIISGGCFGDNFAPVSDTTIVAAATMGVDVPGVVKSRLPYTLVAGALSLVTLTIMGFMGGSSVDISADEYASIVDQANPQGLLMLIPALLVVILALKGMNLVMAMSIGGVVAIGIGLPLGLFKVSDIVLFQDGNVSGSFVSGISGFTGLIIFTFLAYALAHAMNASGAVDGLLIKIKRIVKTPQQAEIVNWFIIALSALGLCNNVTSQIVAGPIMKEIADDYHISLYRTANFSDSVQALFSYTMPWGGPCMVFCATSMLVAESYTWCPAVVNPVTLMPYVVHAYFIGGIFLIAAITGIGRKYDVKVEEEGLGRKAEYSIS